MAKHFELAITDTSFSWQRKQAGINAEAALDGLYVIRTSLAKTQLDANAAVAAYKSLSQVERAFRSIKTVDLQVRPVFHYSASRVRAHVFLCMLAYYVEWHMRQVWRELMFADEDQAAKLVRDPVAPATRSDAAMKKVLSLTLEDGSPVHSFQTLMATLQTIVRNTCRTPIAGNDAPTFEITTTANPKQQHALALIQMIRP